MARSAFLQRLSEMWYNACVLQGACERHCDLFGELVGDLSCAKKYSLSSVVKYF